MAFARACWSGVGGTFSLSQPAYRSVHSGQYKCCMDAADAGVAAYIGRWRPSSVSADAAAFARDVIGQIAPEGRERAKNLLWAAGKLADYAMPLGLEAVPEVLLHPSVTERFARGGAADAADKPAVHRPRGRPAVLPGGPAAAAGAVEEAVQPGGDQRVPGT